MRIAHIIMAHKNPEQLERLIVAMKHPMFDHFVHLDKKSDLNDFKHLKKYNNVFFIKKRIECNWGGFSFVKAILNSVSEALSSGKNYQFVNLMSGQDYPLKTADQLYQFLIENPNRYLLQKITNKLMPRRKFPLDFTLYGSTNSSWWILNAGAAKYLIDFIKDNSKLKRFMKFTWGADEFLITTIIMNSPFKDKVINDNLRHIDWSSGGAHPKIFSKNDLNDLVKTDKYFARKFDVHVDKDILDLIDENSGILLKHNDSQ